MLVFARRLLSREVHLAMLCLLALFGQPAFAAPNPRPWTVKVFGASAPGTGVVVGSDDRHALILTAGHVLDGTSLDDQPTVMLSDGRELPVLSMRVLDTLDLAEVRVAWPMAPHAAVATQAHSGGVVWLGGYPQGSKRFWLRQGPSEEQGQSRVSRPGGYSLFHGVPSTIGLSGAGLYNQRGELIGIHGEADVLRTASGQVFKSGIGLGIPISFWLDDRVSTSNRKTYFSLQDQLLEASWLESMGRLDRAHQLLDQLASKHPGEQRVLLRRAGVLIAKSLYRDALHDLDQLLLQSPNSASLLINRGNALLGLNQDALALSSYQAALKLDPRLVWGYVNQAKAYQALGRWKDAKDSLERAVELSPYDPVVLKERVVVYEHYGMYREALLDLNLLVEKRSEDAGIWARRGIVRGELGDLRGSVEDFTLAVQLEPDNPVHRLNRGATLARLKQWKDAIADFEVAQNQLPRHPILLANLGEAFHALGDVPKACAFAEQANSFGVMWKDGKWNKIYRDQCGIR